MVASHVEGMIRYAIPTHEETTRSLRGLRLHAHLTGHEKRMQSQSQASVLGDVQGCDNEPDSLGPEGTDSEQPSVGSS